MADVNYVITIKGSGNESQNKKKKVASSSNGEPVESRPRKPSESKKALDTIGITAAAGYALRATERIVTAEMNRVELRSGNALLQEKINYTYSLTKNTLLSAAAIIGGAITGNVPAVVAGAMSFANLAINRAIEINNVKIAQQVENVGLSYANIRAGTSGSRNRG